MSKLLFMKQSTASGRKTLNSFKKCRGNICHYIIGKVYLFLCFEFKAHLKDKGQSGCEQIIWTRVQNKALNPNDKFVVQN